MRLAERNAALEACERDANFAAHVVTDHSAAPIERCAARAVLLLARVVRDHLLSVPIEVTT